MNKSTELVLLNSNAGRLLAVAAFVACAAALPACGGRPTTTGELETRTGSISAEMSGVVDFVTRHYMEPEILRASFAVGDLGSCSGTMIGPNLMITSAGCGGFDRDITFRSYWLRSAGAPMLETFVCIYLFQTGPDTDLAVFNCRPNPIRGNPGDLYGYLDPAAVPVSVDQPVYSLFHRPVGATGAGGSWMELYAPGRITAVGGAAWFSPDSLSLGVTMDVFSEPGVNGAPHLDPVTHRMVVGPLSETSLPEGRFRRALSMRDYLTHARVTDAPASRSIGGLRWAGLAPDDYLGRIDKNDNQLLDVQEDLEAIRGESARGYYWLAFDSPRRNALWTASPMVSFDADQGVARINKPSAFRATIASHTRLNLSGDTHYRVGFTLSTTSASLPARGLTICFGRGGVCDGYGDDSATVATVPGDRDREVVVRLRARASGSALYVIAEGSLDATLRSLKVVRDDATIDFDSADSRSAWHQGDRPAIVLPDGASPLLVFPPEWAGLVSRGPTELGTPFPLTSRHLALEAFRNYRVCFTRRVYLPSPGPSGDWGVVRVTSGATLAAERTFRVGAFWEEACTPTFRTTSAANTVAFGSRPVAPTRFAVEYLVDDVRIEVDPAPPAPLALHRLTLSRSETCGSPGKPVTVELTAALSAIAFTDVVVTVSASDPAVIVPSTVTIPRGATQAMFSAEIPAGTPEGTITFAAEALGVRRTAAFVIAMVFPWGGCDEGPIRFVDRFEPRRWWQDCWACTFQMLGDDGTVIARRGNELLRFLPLEETPVVSKLPPGASLDGLTADGAVAGTVWLSEQAGQAFTVRPDGELVWTAGTVVPAVDPAMSVPLPGQCLAGYAVGMSAQGMVVGNGIAEHATLPFIHHPDLGTALLQELLATNGVDLQLTSVIGMNARGQILAEGLLDEQPAVFLLDPHKPE